MAETEKLIEIYNQLEDAGLMVVSGKKESAELMVSRDVVPVVRCKDCKHFDGKRHCWRNYKPGLTGANMVDAEDFCSCGERRTDG